jgi:hypothetical protein
MNYVSVSQIVEAITASRDKLVSRVSGLNSAESEMRNGANAWSVAEIVEHLAKTESGLVPVFFRLLKKSEADAKSSDGTINPPLSFERFRETIATEKFQAPEIIRPIDSCTIEASLVQLMESRETILNLRPRIEAVDCSLHTFPHPAFGPLNLYAWLAFIGLHESRHYNQIETTLAIGKANSA